MSLSIFDLRKKFSPTEIWQRNVGYAEYSSGAKVQFKVPNDHFIHAIFIRVELGTLSGGTSPAWNSDAKEKIIKSITLTGDGTKVIKRLLWKHTKAIAIMNKENLSDGFTKLYFTDPKIPQAKPLPSWSFTNLILEFECESLSNLTTGDPTSGTAYFHITLIESEYKGEDLSGWQILVEQYPVRKSFGTQTGELLYEHEKTYDVVGFLYHIDDNGTDSNTAIEWITLYGRHPKGQNIIVDKAYVSELREQNKLDYGIDMPTGMFSLEFPNPLKTRAFTSLYTKVYIGTAGTDVGLRVVERYII